MNMGKHMGRMAVVTMAAAWVAATAMTPAWADDSSDHGHRDRHDGQEHELSLRVVAKQVDSNTAGIAANQAVIDQNGKAIKRNLKRNKINAKKVGVLNNDVAANTKAIGQNGKAIKRNLKRSKINAKNLAMLQNNIATNKGDIDNNTAAIAGNTTAIGDNTTAIAGLNVSTARPGILVAANTYEVGHRVLWDAGWSRTSGGFTYGGLKGLKIDFLPAGGNPRASYATLASGANGIPPVTPGAVRQVRLVASYSHPGAPCTGMVIRVGSTAFKVLPDVATKMPGKKGKNKGKKPTKKPYPGSASAIGTGWSQPVDDASLGTTDAPIRVQPAGGAICFRYGRGTLYHVEARYYDVYN